MIEKLIFFLLWRCDPTRVMASSFLRFLDHTQRRTTFCRTPLDEWSVCRRDLYLTTHNTHDKQTSMHPVEFEPTISAGEWPQTYALDGASTGTGRTKVLWIKTLLPEKKHAVDKNFQAQNMLFGYNRNFNRNMLFKDEKINISICCVPILFS